MLQHTLAFQQILQHQLLANQQHQLIQLQQQQQQQQQSRQQVEKAKSPGPSPIASLPGGIPSMIPGLPALPSSILSSSVRTKAEEDKPDNQQTQITMPPINLANFEPKEPEHKPEHKSPLLNGGIGATNFSPTRKKSPHR